MRIGVVLWSLPTNTTCGGSRRREQRRSIRRRGHAMHGDAGRMLLSPGASDPGFNSYLKLG